MKKVLFSLIALVCSMSMSAQVMKVMKNGQDTPVETYYGSDYYVVFEEAPATTGTAVATIGGNDVNVGWVQLWAGGPKFAEYNVGVTDGKAESFGGLYCWGGSIDKDPNGAYKDGTDALTGDDDTATNLWGNAWRMPTKDELDALNELDALYNNTNCDVTWTYNYNGSGVQGRIYTGKGDFASNSIFLPAAGCFEDGNFQPMSTCFYWSSTPKNDYSYYMYFGDGTYGANIRDTNRRTGYSVRAVLAE